MKIVLMISCIFLAFVSQGCSTPFSTVPTSGKGWSLAEGPNRATPEEIRRRAPDLYDILSEKGLREMRCWRYQADGKSVSVEIYAMLTPNDAHDVFSAHIEGEEVDIGIPALYSPSGLKFARGVYFVRVVPETGALIERNVIMDIGRTVAAGIPGIAMGRGLLSMLPREGLVPGSVRYNRGTAIEDTALLDERRLLSLSGTTENVIAQYKTEKGDYTLILVRYPDSAAMQQAWKQFQEYFIPVSIEAPSSVIINDASHGWIGAIARDSVIYIIIGAKDNDACGSALDSLGR